MEEPNEIKRTIYLDKNYTVDKDGNIIELDPLQKIIDENNMNIKEAIIKIINERYNK